MRYTVSPPTFRQDISIPADIVEEIARIYGYHNLPSKLMDTPIPTNKPTDANYVIENRIKHFLADIGWQEIYCYSMVSQEIAEQSGFELEDHLKLQNPLTDDRIYMRRSLLPSLEEIIDTNSQYDQQSVFELAFTYQLVAGKLPVQKLQLGMVSSKEYKEVKGDLESLLTQFFVEPTFTRVTDDAKGLAALTQQAVIKVGKTAIGTIGILPSGKTGISISIEQLLAVAEVHPTYQPIPKSSLVSEDLTFTLPEKTAVGDVVTAISQVSELIRSVLLKGQYNQNSTFSIVYHNPKQNITSEEVAPVREKIVANLATKFSAKLIGDLG
jgi:phenylalanyl-tRNA synthetase beta chain